MSLGISFAGTVLCSAKPQDATSSSPSQPFVAQPVELSPGEVPLSFGDTNKVWTLPELVDEALEHNPTTTQAWEQANAAAAQVGVAKSAYAPKVTLGVSGTAAHDTEAGYLGAQEINQLNAAPQLQIQYLLLDFGARKAGLALTRFNLLNQNFTFNRALQQVVLGVMTSYYNLDAAKVEVENAETALNLTEATLQAAKIKRKTGLTNITDEIQAQQSVEQSKFNLENALGLRSTAEIQLASSLGLPGNVKIHVAPPSNPPALEALEQEVDKLIDLAFHQRPDLAAKYYLWQAQLAAVDQAEANRWPTLTTGVNLQRTYYQAHEEGLGSNSGHFDDASALVTFRFDLFDGGYKNSQVATSRHLAEAAKADLLNSELGVVSDVVTSFVTFKTAVKKMSAAQALVAASQKSFDSIQISYRNGLKSILDLLAAQSNLNAAQSTLSQAQKDLFSSSAVLSNATGSLLASRPTSAVSSTPLNPEQ